MNPSEFRLLLRQTFDGLVSLSDRKGVEYRAGDADELANFNRLAVKLDLPREKVLMVFLTKHLDSIDNHVRQIGKDDDGPDPTEPIDGRIDDAILYLVLLKAMLRETAAPEAVRFPSRRESFFRTSATSSAPDER